MTSNTTPLREQILKILSLHEDIGGQVLLNDTYDALGNWQYAVDELLALFEQQKSELIKRFEDSLPAEINWNLKERRQFSTRLEDSITYQVAYNSALKSVRQQLEKIKNDNL